MHKEISQFVFELTNLRYISYRLYQTHLKKPAARWPMLLVKELEHHLLVSQLVMKYNTYAKSQCLILNL